MLNEDEFDVFNYFPISKGKEHRDASDSGYHMHIPQRCLIAFRPSDRSPTGEIATMFS